MKREVIYATTTRFESPPLMGFSPATSTIHIYPSKEWDLLRTRSVLVENTVIEMINHEVAHWATYLFLTKAEQFLTLERCCELEHDKSIIEKIAYYSSGIW